MLCPHCNNDVKEGALYCSKCGNPILEQASPTKNRRTPVAIAACVAAVLAIAVVVIFVVLPRMARHGVWVVTKQVGTFEYTTTERNDTDVETLAYTLDNNGRVVLTTYTRNQSTQDVPVIKQTSYKYDDNGFCKTVDSSFISPPDSDLSNHADYQWTFGNAGRPERLTVADNFSCTYQYNDNGYISQQILNDDVSSTIYEYNDRGLLMKCTQSSKGDDGIATGVSVYEYEFDSSGKPIASTTVMTVTSGEITIEKAEEVNETYEYDATGNVKKRLSESTYYCDDGSVLRKRKASIEYEYAYIENPSPWTVQGAHLGCVPYSIVERDLMVGSSPQA